jgi:hypothetical protein
MPLSRFVALIGFALAVGLALGGGRWAIRPLLICWTVASQREEDDTESAGATSGKLTEAEVNAAFGWRLASLVPEKPGTTVVAAFDSGEWAARESKRRCGVLALLLSGCIGGSYYAAKWVSRREETAAGAG